MDSSKPTRIVILGGGYVSIWAYRAMERKLRSLLRRGEVEITVVCPENYHNFHGWSAEAIGGIIGLTHRLSPLRTIFRRARLIRGRAVRVDLDERFVSVNVTGPGGRKSRVDFDHLLMGMGVRDRKEAVPGLDTRGHVFRETGGLLGFRNQVFSAVEQAESVRDPAACERLLSFVVAGGGFAGVEMCAALAEMLQVWTRHYPVLRRQRPRLTLLHAGDALLPELRPRYNKLADYATRQLQDYDVDLRLGTRLERVDEEGAVLVDGSTIPAATILSTIGTTYIPLQGMEALERNNQGRLHVDKYLRVPGEPRIWAGGDCAYVKYIQTGEACPANALWAIKHGEWVGHNMAHAILGKPLSPFTYRGLGQAASLGVGKGALELYGLQFTGWAAWFMRLGFFLHFMPSWIQRAKVVLDWLSLPVFGRTLIPMDPPRRTASYSTANGHTRTVKSRNEYRVSNG